MIKWNWSSRRQVPQEQEDAPVGKQGGRYLLLDSQEHLLAQGDLISPPDAPSIQIQVLENRIGEVMKHEIINLIGVEDDTPSLLGRIILRRKDVVVLDKLKTLAGSVRQNLRMPMSFDSFIYPVTEDPIASGWQGRRRIVSKDLSCAGIAFYCEESLTQGEHIEVVIPVTGATLTPLVVQCEILRHWEGDSPHGDLYSGKFIEICHDEEKLIQTAVFNVQLMERTQNNNRRKR